MITTFYAWVAQMIFDILSYIFDLQGANEALSKVHEKLSNANKMTKYAARKYTYDSFMNSENKESKLFVLNKSLIWLPIDVKAKNCKVKMSDFFILGQPKNENVVMDVILQHENSMKKRLNFYSKNDFELLINDFELGLPFSKIQAEKTVKVRRWYDYEKMALGDPIIIDDGKFWNDQWCELASIHYLAELFLNLEYIFPQQGELIFTFLGIHKFCPKKEKKLKLE